MAFNQQTLQIGIPFSCTVNIHYSDRRLQWLFPYSDQYKMPRNIFTLSYIIFTSNNIDRQTAYFPYSNRTSLSLRFSYKRVLTVSFIKRTPPVAKKFYTRSQQTERVGFERKRDRRTNHQKFFVIFFKHWICKRKYELVSQKKDHNRGPSPPFRPIFLMLCC